MRNLRFIAIILVFFSCTPKTTGLKKIYVFTDFFSTIGEDYIYTHGNHALYIVPMLEFGDSLVHHGDLPPMFKCFLEENNNPTAVETVYTNGQWGKIKLSSIDTLLKKRSTLFNRNKEDREVLEIYSDEFKVSKKFSKHGKIMETLLPHIPNTDCLPADTIYVTYDKKYNWVTKISLSDDEKKRGMKISRVHRIYNARYCNMYKQYAPRRFVTFSLEELPVNNPARIDSIFAKLIPYLPKK